MSIEIKLSEKQLEQGANREAQEWVDEQIANGFNKSEIRLSYGYEDDIESVDFIVSK